VSCRGHQHEARSGVHDQCLLSPWRLMPVQQLGRCHVELLSDSLGPMLQADHPLRAHRRHSLMLDGIAAGALSTVVKADWALLHAILLHADKLQLPALHTKQLQILVSSEKAQSICSGV